MRSIRFTYREVIPHEHGVTRRDPSDVIRVGDNYYVWYTRIVDGPGVFEYPSGYSGEVWYATSPDGLTFTEASRSIGLGGPDMWDEHGVFSPNILVHEDRYFLYYTAVPRPFDHQTRTAMGVAVADRPDGPWSPFEGNPILEPRESTPDAFDSMRVDDSAVVVRDGRVWLFFKGRSKAHGQAGPGKTRMGVAISHSPTGPFERSPSNPLHSGHEVLVWPQQGGIASLATAAGPKLLYHAADGLTFDPHATLIAPPAAPGIYRADHFRDGVDLDRPTWGISMRAHGRDVELVRYDLTDDEGA